MQRAATAHPVVDIFAKVNFYTYNLAMVWGHIRGCLALRNCADRMIIIIERGADLVRICKIKYFFRGPECLTLCTVSTSKQQDPDG
jgi:hypothetical protein